MLSKQSIRGKVEVLHEGRKLEKEEIIALSEVGVKSSKISLERC